jgi:hypothetical protein
MVRRRFFSAVSNHGPRRHPSRRAPCQAWRAPHATTAKPLRGDEGLLCKSVCNGEENQHITRLFLFRRQYEQGAEGIARDQ